MAQFLKHLRLMVSLRFHFYLVLVIAACTYVSPGLASPQGCSGAQRIDMDEYPWSAVGALFTVTPNRAYLGTAFMISDRLLVTAQHNVVSTDFVSDFFWVPNYRPIADSAFIFVPGLAQLDRNPIDQVLQGGTSAKVIAYGRRKFSDWAILRLSTPHKLPSGAIKMVRTDRVTLNSSRLITGGFSCTQGSRTIFSIYEGSLFKTIEEFFFGPMVVGFNSAKGHSGGPVFIEPVAPNDEWRAVGILIRGSILNANGSGIEISEELFHAVEKALAEEEGDSTRCRQGRSCL